MFIPKFSSTNAKNVTAEGSNHDVNDKNDKHIIINNILGQGDAIQQSTSKTSQQIVEQSFSATTNKHECQYTIYELLNRYRN